MLIYFVSEIFFLKKIILIIIKIIIIIIIIIITPKSAVVLKRNSIVSSFSDVKCGNSSVENTIKAFPSNCAACSIGLTKS